MNLDYWFHPHITRALSHIRNAIEATPATYLRDFYRVAFSACIKDLSLADPRLTVPVRQRTDQYPPGHWLRERSNHRLRKLRSVDPLSVFHARLSKNRARIAAVATLSQASQLPILDDDARQLRSVASRSVQLAITSPPYVGAQKYIRASSLQLGWLGLCRSTGLRALEDLNIGREHHPKRTYRDPLLSGIRSADRLINDVREENPLRAHIAASYLVEMRDAVAELYRVLRPGGYLVLVAGPGLLCGRQFPTPLFLQTLAEETGLRCLLHLQDRIRSRVLMTKRHRTASVIDSESVLLFRKES